MAQPASPGKIIPSSKNLDNARSDALVVPLLPH
jgi:hypothetical protein